METKTCTKCGNTKNINDFIFRKKRKCWESVCSFCRTIISQKYYANNKEKLKQHQKEYRIKNKHIDQIWSKNNPNYRKEWAAKHREQLNEGERKRRKLPESKLKRNKKRKDNKNKNPAIKLRENISRSIRYVLKDNNGSKHNTSCLKHLGYTPKQLIDYLESLWEKWMNWSNYGVFKYGEKRWNIDHIIPQSKLPYSSMEEENFKRCWALSNLRPLEAMENIKKSNK